jgi:hypothetical protein
VTAAFSALIAFVVASPGLAYLISSVSRPAVPGRRYATYDPELYLFGISITPATAQVFTFGIAPALIVLSAYLVVRGLQNGRRGAATDEKPD